jgi:hypothetical protein
VVPFLNINDVDAALSIYKVLPLATVFSEIVIFLINADVVILAEPDTPNA